MLAQSYLVSIQQLLASSQEQLDVIGEIAAKIAESIIAGGIVHTFGSGHSDMIAKEVTGRAGGLVPVSRINDPTGGEAERVEGLAEALLVDYERKCILEKDEIMIIISNSGRNAVPIEICLGAKDRGLTTVAVTSVSFSRKLASRHSGGKNLYEIADYVLDTGVGFGDTLVAIPNSPHRSGPGSTIMGAFLMNTLMLSVIEKIQAEGKELPILKSKNVDGAEEGNERLKEKYRGRICR